MADFMHFLNVGTWTASTERIQSAKLKASFQYLKTLCDNSYFHRKNYAMIIDTYLDLVPYPSNQAWTFLQTFISDENLSVPGRNNAVRIVLKLFEKLHKLEEHHTLVVECVYMLVTNMTSGIHLEKVSLNKGFYDRLDNGAAAKQPGIGLYTLLGSKTEFLWPVCCRQLNRLMDVENGSLKAIKILIGLFDFRHHEGLPKENTSECNELVASLLDRAKEHTELDPYVDSIKRALMRDNHGKGLWSSN